MIRTYEIDEVDMRNIKQLERDLAAARCVIKDYREEIAKLEAELAKVRQERDALRKGAVGGIMV